MKCNLCDQILMFSIAGVGYVDGPALLSLQVEYAHVAVVQAHSEHVWIGRVEVEAHYTARKRTHILWVGRILNINK